jgi:hypothetical protein
MSRASYTEIHWSSPTVSCSSAILPQVTANVTVHNWSFCWLVRVNKADLFRVSFVHHFSVLLSKDNQFLTLGYLPRSYVIVCYWQQIAVKPVVFCERCRLLSFTENFQIPVLSRNKKARRSHSIKIDNSSFEREEQFKYLGTTLSHQNFIQEEIKRSLKSGSAYYHSVHNLSFSIRIMKANEMHYFWNLFDKVLYMFRTSPLSIIRGYLNTVYTQ